MKTNQLTEQNGVPRSEAPLSTPAVVLCIGGILLLFGVVALNGIVE